MFNYNPPIIELHTCSFILVGLDVVVWNLHRRYGNHRLPLLLCDWTEVECVGWSAELAQSNVTYTAVYEPVFILSPN